MVAKTITSVLVTGANAGLGKECARQLGLKEGVTKVYLGCRNEEKAKEAKADLEESTGKKDIFEVLIIDVSKPDSVKSAVKNLPGTVDGLVLNAGGKGGVDHMAKTDYGVPAVVAINVLGHVLLIDELLKAKKMTSGASIVLSGSEAARGVKAFMMPRPDIQEGTVEEMVKYVDGSIYDGKDQSFEATYGPTKYLGALYMSSMARKEPSIRFVTMSPGGTTGTNVSHDLPRYQQVASALVVPILSLMGKLHSVETGAKRYVDALCDEETYKSGVFYASTKGVSGPVSDQTCYMDDFKNETYQDNVHTALHKFLE